ncbi:MAG: D-glycerate dehydrogenase [Pseudomonadota bacterium]|nr:D-glycerate dehydrogenase [Pseudomonadota bacterium]
MARKPRVIVTRKLPQVIEKRIAERFDAKFNTTDTQYSKKQLIESVKSSNILVSTVTDNIDREVVTSAGLNFGLIANFGAGVNHIDLAAAKEMKLLVSNTPDVLTEDTADLAMALILMASRRLGEGERLIRSGGWAGWAPTQLMGQSLFGKRLGIIGMGRIGRALALRARAFGISIHYYNRRRLDLGIEENLGACYWPNLEVLLSNVDIVSIHTPYTNRTANLLDRDKLNCLNTDSIVINTARGGLRDENALIEKLKTCEIKAAGFDVFNGEPNVNPDLLDLENVVLLPHLGSATLNGRIAMGEKVLLNIQHYLDKENLPDKVMLDDV